MIVLAILKDIIDNQQEINMLLVILGTIASILYAMWASNEIEKNSRRHLEAAKVRDRMALALARARAEQYHNRRFNFGE